MVKCYQCNSAITPKKADIGRHYICINPKAINKGKVKMNGKCKHGVEK